MFIVNNPICGQCGKAFMAREFNAGDQILMLILFLTGVGIPLSMWLYFMPKRFECAACGFVLSEKNENIESENKSSHSDPGLSK